MTQLQLFKIAAKMIKEGKTNEEIRTELFKTKGARLSQIKKTMNLISSD